MKIGVLCLQGAVREHLRLLEKCDVDAVCVKKKEQLADIEGLIIPGGESTTIGKLIDRFDLGMALRKFIQQKKAVYGTCAGLIMLANQVVGSDQYTLGGMDIVVERNAFGRQRESFEEDLLIPVLGGDPFRAVFIRAPLVKSYADDVEVLAVCSGEVVAARQGNLLVSSFHPELTEDTRMHEFFIRLAKAQV